MQLRSIIGQPGNISRVKLRQTTIQLGKSAEFDDVGHRLGLTTGAQISVCKAPSFSTGPAMLSWEAETRDASYTFISTRIYERLVAARVEISSRSEQNIYGYNLLAPPTYCSRLSRRQRLWQKNGGTE